MSAFVGLLLLDGTPCAQTLVEAMLGRLRHRVDARGWSAARVRCDGSVGLGYAPLLSTPEAVWDVERPDEAQTLTHNGLSLWITSEVRLDNRTELAENLKLDAQEAREWSDGRIILESYARWGNETPGHLRGDFAFAIWDAARHRLFCARDRFGTKPFYYAYKAGHFFAFANEIKALWPVPGLDADINEAQIGNYLLSTYDDKSSTFYAAVRRLPPARWFEVETKYSGELRENSYWELDAQRELLLSSDEDYAVMLREGFTNSVRDRMRSDKFAVFLSGGLDSSSIAAVAQSIAPSHQRPVPAFSTVYDRFIECDESELIKQTLSRGEFEPTWMKGDNISPLHNIDRLIWHLDQPSPGPNSCSAWARYALLHKSGLHALLDGHGGDEVIFLGYERVWELLRQGDFSTAWREARLLRSHGTSDGPPMALMWQGLLWHARGKRGLGRLIALWTRSQARRQKRRETQRLRRGALGTSERDMDVIASRMLRPELASLLKNQSAEGPMRSVRDLHFRDLNGPLQPLALEALNAMASAYAIEPRYPFWEQRMVEMCLSFPAEQKMKNGFNRYVMRQAMEGVLAPEVQWRIGKTDFSPQLSENLRVLEHEQIDQMLELWEATTLSGVGQYVNLNEVRAQWLNLQDAPPSSMQAAIAAISLWKVLSLGIWLSQQKDANSTKALS